MKIINKNEGRYIPYKLSKNSLSLNDELTLNLDKYERDDSVRIDICFDRNKTLVMGVIPGIAELYAAQIEIPAREYTEVDSGKVNENDEPIYVPEPVPFEPKNITLTLWGLEEI